MDFKLSPAAVRVLGALIEKEATTPDYYPLSLNALVNACNQKSNREPVMQLSEEEVVVAVDELKQRRLIWQRSVAGARVFKYEHNIKSIFPLSEHELGALCVLLLRGAQTVGEVRLRTERLCTFASLDEAEKVLRNLCSRPNGAIVLELPRRTGRKEARFMHLFSGEAWALEQQSADEFQAVSSAAAPVSPVVERIEALEAAVALLTEELVAVRKEFGDFKKLLE